jgi:hypothetical protein
LQFQTVLVGALLLFSALAAFALRHLAGLEPGLFQLYLSTPTILAWTSGEMQFARPLIGTRPKHSAEITGMFAHGLQILGALVLWIFLGLSVGTDSLAWMGWTAAGLSVVGMLVALSTNAPAPSTQGAGPRAKTWQQLRQIEKTGPS